MNAVCCCMWIGCKRVKDCNCAVTSSVGVKSWVACLFKAKEITLWVDEHANWPLYCSGWHLFMMLERSQDDTLLILSYDVHLYTVIWFFVLVLLCASRASCRATWSSFSIQGVPFASLPHSKHDDCSSTVRRRQVSRVVRIQTARGRRR